MKMCQPHWDALREAIKNRGLMDLVSKNGQVAIDRTVAQLNGDDSKRNYDPLVNANFAIWTNALKAGGLYLMGTDEHGNDYCPLCELDKHAKLKDGEGQASVQWINDCADGQLAIVQEMGLLPQAS